tara:strand:- start:796 stop:2310 length:1515 start_codon:yes stop_codon:yes gene_type:complete
MADTITEFSNHTGKTYSELKTGVSLASTTGSQQAVVRDVAIKNPKGRAVKLKIGSTTGMEVANSSATSDVLSGTELLKASSSLVLHTEVSPLFTHFEMVGWGNGHNQNTLQRDSTIKYKIGAIPFESYGDGANDGAWEQGESSTQSTRNGTWMYSLSHYRYFTVGGAKQEWFISRRGDNGYGSRNRLYRTNASGDATSMMNPCHLMFYDGSQYLYGFSTGSTYKRFDTINDITNTNSTDITIRPDGGSATSGTNYLDFSTYGSSGYFYKDPSTGVPYALVYAQDGNSSQRRARIVELTTGKSRMIYDISHSNLSGSFGASSVRRTCGIVRDSAGDHWAYIGAMKSSSYANNGNTMSICKLGQNITTNFLDPGQNYTLTYAYDALDAGIADKGADAQRTWSYNMGGDGEGIHAQAGHALLSPDTPRYAFLMGDKYGRNTDRPSGTYGCRLDFDNVSDLSKFFTPLAGDWSEGNGQSGIYRAYTVDSDANAAFGTVDVRTTGILTT